MPLRKIRSKIEVLKEAGPWIKRFFGKIFVVKVGGEILKDQESLDNYADDVVLLSQLGMRVAVIHGGGPQLEKKLSEKNIQFEKKNGVRVYTAEILEISRSVFSSIARDISDAIEQRGIKTKLIPQKSKEPDILAKKVENFGLVGDPYSINVKSLKLLLQRRIIPVISPFGKAEDGDVICFNADKMASFIAGAIGAEKLIVITQAEGVYDQQSKVISRLTSSKAGELISQSVITNGMVVKVLSCLESREVKKIHIIDGRKPHCMLYEVFTDKGIGTEIVR